ncbi:MAG: glycosyltransferase [Gammaproteobacteria bacterium]|nr:glycosyltransferase [Gammaproteobacteria bacterium]
MNSNIDVIIPTYNRRHTLGRSIDSVIAQSLKPAEIIIVDDGSTDGTEDYINKNYPDITYIKTRNKGVSAARNQGIRQSRNDWLAFLDSDDEWLPEKLEKQVTAASSEKDYKLIHCDEIWVRNGIRVNSKKKHEKSGGDIFLKCLPMCVISPSAAIVHRVLFDELGHFDEALPACEDYDLWLRICAVYPVLYINTPLLIKYGGHKDQLSREYWGMDRFRVEALSKILRTNILSGPQRIAANETLRKKCKILINGAEKRANRNLIRACRGLMEEFH